MIQPKCQVTRGANDSEMVQLCELSSTHRLSPTGQKDGQGIPEGFGLAPASAWT